MIKAFSFTCERDRYLFECLKIRLNKWNINIDPWVENHNELDGMDKYIRVNPSANGAGWEGFMAKLKAYRHYAERMNDDDVLWHLDSDSLPVNQKMLDDIKLADIVGFQHTPKYKTELGDFGHFSGCSIAMSGKLVKAIADQPDSFYNLTIRNQLKRFYVCENEDVVLSYIAFHLGATSLDLSSLGYVMGDAHSYFELKVNADFLHHNTDYKSFMGKEVTGKWDVGRILISENLL